jgi:hypothetical protein
MKLSEMAERAERREVVRDKNSRIIGWLVREGPRTRVYDRDERYLGYSDRVGTYDLHSRRLYSTEAPHLLLCPCLRGVR